MTLDVASPRASSGPPRPTPRIPATRRAVRALRVLAGALLLLSCEDVLVRPVEVASVRVVPETADLLVGQQQQMSVEVRDASDNVLGGRDVTWSSADETVVRVSDAGMASAVGPGTATVRATVEGRTGTASLTVKRPVTIVADRGSVAFSATAGGADPAPVRIQLSNGGEGILEGLAVEPVYDGPFSGWLDLELEGTTAPAALIVAARVGSLAAGTYSASVVVSAAAAANSPVTLGVTFQVQQNVPGAPSSLMVTAVTDSTVALGWNDNSEDETEFRVERLAPGETGFSVLATTEPGVVTYVDSDVVVDALYQYRVRACGPTGCSGYSNPASATTPPTAPTDPTATATSTTSVDIEWLDNSATETSFRVERRQGTAAFAEVGDVAADQTTFSDTGLQAGTGYDYRVRACNAGGCSAYSATVAATTPTVPLPAAPSGLTATATSASEIALAWTDNSDDETGFQVERRAPGQEAFALLATTGADAETFSDTDVTADGTYAYRVRACVAAGCSAFTTTASATTPPVAPSGLTATAISNTRIDLEWTDESATETAFAIERRTGTAAFVQIATTGPNVRSYADVELRPATGYEYQVRACNGSGCSDYSATATATTLTTPAPAAPTDLTATLGAATGPATLAWTDNSADETGFRIQRSVDGGTFADLATVDADVTTLVDSGLSADHEYGYRVEACGAGGCSAFTNTATVVTLPVPATGLAATATSPTSVALAWSDQSRTETEFRIERRTGTGSFGPIGAVAADSTAYLDTSAAPGTEYGYRVLACNATGCAASSESRDTTALVAPTGLTATTLSPVSVRLAWVDASGNETGFRIERASGAGAFTEVATTAPDATTYTDSGLTPNVDYTYRVRACNAVACSEYSGEAAATTSSAPAAPTGLEVTTISAGQVDVSWTDNSDDETDFLVERSVNGGAFADLIVLGTDATGHSDTSVSEDTEYAYRVSACNGGACSAPAGPASTVTPPTAASTLAATARSTSEIDLAWADNSDQESEFRIQRRTGANPFAAAGTVGADVRTFRDTGLAAATAYEYRVLACNAGGCAPPSNVATATTPDNAPAAPSGLSATGRTSPTRVELAWTDASNNETEFRIERAVGGTETFESLATVGAGVVAYVDDTVDPDTPYAYRVSACNADGCSAPTTRATVTTHPVAPSDLTAEATSDTRIDLKWLDESATETSFQVERRTGTGAFAPVATLEANATGYASTGLAQSTSYGFRVRACNGGGCSDYTAVATATTLSTPPPADPSDLSAALSGSGATIELAWTDNSTTESEFRIHRSVDGGTFAERATVAANTTSFSDGSITLDHRYTYRVDACSAAGCSGFTNEATAVTRPAAPTALNTTVVSATQIDLAWTDEADTEDDFRLERSVDGGAFELLTSPAANATSYSDVSTTADHTYGYRIQACNAGGCSTYSGTATATTPPSAATGLTATAASHTQIDLSWTDNSSTETEFRVQRRSGGGEFALVATVGAGVTSHSDTGLAPDTDYDYRVLACNAAGCAPASSVASASTDPMPVPATPTGLAADMVSAGQIDLSWTDNATTEDEFRLERSIDGGVTFGLLTSPAANATSYSDVSTTADRTYAYRIQACNAGGCSDFSSEATASTPPAAASGLTATAASHTQIDLSWTDNSSTETEFRIERQSGGGGFAQVATVGAGVTSHSDTGLEPDTDYDYRVLACSAAGCAPASSVASAATDPIPPPATPSGLAAEMISAGEIDLSWTDNATTEDEFRLERSNDGGVTFGLLTSPAANATSYSDVSTTADRTYAYRIQACNAGGCSDFSSEATASTPPAEASDLTATAASHTQIDLSWADNSSTETEFRIERSGGEALVITVGAGVTSHSDTDLAPETTYEYQVLACNAAGCAPASSVASATTDPIPPPIAPSGLAADMVSAEQINLSWTDNATTEDEFRIERSIDGGVTFEFLSSPPANATSHSDLTTEADRTYAYRIQACGAGGCSDFTPEATASTPPAGATGLTAEAVSETRIDLTWTDNSSTETEFRIERRSGGGGFEPVATAAADATNHSDSGLNSDTEYEYQVLACNAAGCAPASNVASATTEDD